MPPDLVARYLALQENKNGNIDIEYLNDQISSHEDALAVFQQEMSNGENPELIGDSRRAARVIRRNLKLLQRTLQSRE